MNTSRPRKTIILRLDHYFHPTSCTVRARVESLSGRTFGLSEAQIAKVSRELCGMKDCCCDSTRFTAWDSDGNEWHYRNA